MYKSLETSRVHCPGLVPMSSSPSPTPPFSPPSPRPWFRWFIIARCSPDDHFWILSLCGRSHPHQSLRPSPCIRLPSPSPPLFLLPSCRGVPNRRISLPLPRLTRLCFRSGLPSFCTFLGSPPAPSWLSSPPLASSLLPGILWSSGVRCTYYTLVPSCLLFSAPILRCTIKPKDNNLRLRRYGVQLFLRSCVRVLGFCDDSSPTEEGLGRDPDSFNLAKPASH